MAITLDHKPAIVKGNRRKKRKPVHTFSTGQETIKSSPEEQNAPPEIVAKNTSTDKHEIISEDFKALEAKEESNGSGTVVRGEVVTDHELENNKQLVVKGESNGSHSVLAKNVEIFELSDLESLNEQDSIGVQTVVKIDLATTEKGGDLKEESNGSHEDLYNASVLFELVGVQLNILKFLFNFSDDSGITEKMTIDRICNGTGVNKSSIKAAILRLKKKGALNIHFRKNGRGGFCIYKIPNSVFLELLKERNRDKQLH